MNTTRMLLGGLVAAVILTASEGILNAVILMDAYTAAMEASSLTEASWAMVGYIGGTVLFGFVLAWLYAALRPRFGPGGATAIRAAAVVWLVGYLVPTVWFGAMGMGMGAGAVTLALVWGLAELILAGMAAGWVYREDGGAAPPAAGMA